MSDVVSWNLQLAVAAGQLDDWRSLMEEMVQATKGEAGALGYEWFISDDGRSCHICERYADSAAVMAHLGNFGSKFADRFMALATPTALWVYGDASDEVRTALEPFGAVHLGNFGGFSR